MYYWVNQGKTYKEEKEGGYLWAPIQNSDGKSFFHWDNMRDLYPNDIVFNYRNGYIVSYCVVESECFEAPQPDEFNVDVEWESQGLMVDARYYVLKERLPIKTVYDNVKDLLPDKYAPITAAGKTVKANQGYLYELSDEVANRIVHLADLHYLKKPESFGIVQEEEVEYKVPDSTSRKGLVTSRVGQGEYRRRILQRWYNKCAVTQASTTEVLIASHIVPWREATDRERLDIHNGILLSPVYDALFDRHLISFNDDGSIILSKSISDADYAYLGITGEERIENLSESNKEYLKRHRENLVKI